MHSQGSIFKDYALDFFIICGNISYEIPKGTTAA